MVTSLSTHPKNSEIMTPEKKVTVLGEELDIRFNMAVEIAYEDITNEPFSFQSLERQKNIVALCMAAIIVNNPETKITAERFIREVASDEYNAIVSTVIEAMTEWMKIPSVIPQDKPSEEEAEKAEDSKNA